MVHRVAKTGELYIKRVVGLPGDTVQMINGRLYINGQMVERRIAGTSKDTDSFGEAVTVTRYLQTLPSGVEHYINEIADDFPLDDTHMYSVPPGHYFVMGDNHDRSVDSRVLDIVGYVPAADIVGRLDDQAAVEIPGR